MIHELIQTSEISKDTQKIPGTSNLELSMVLRDICPMKLEDSKYTVQLGSTAEERGQKPTCMQVDQERGCVVRLTYQDETLTLQSGTPSGRNPVSIKTNPAYV